MIKKRFTVWNAGLLGQYIKKNGTPMHIEEVVDLLNELDEKYVDEFALRETLQQELQIVENENEQLKKILNELSDMLQFDVENGIRSYPVKLSEYLSNALKELKE